MGQHKLFCIGHFKYKITKYFKMLKAYLNICVLGT